MTERLPDDTVITVGRLNRMARELLETGLPPLWITGEISNLVRAASGHVYFTLKDERAQVRCTLWRNRAQLLPFHLEQGQKVEIRALATLYEARGDFQLSVDTVRRAGVGNLYEAFLRLRAELEREGLFDPASKRSLPRYPVAIGVVTSPQAAALRDVLAALARRAPGVPVILYPAPVQGDDAPAKLAGAIDQASSRCRDDRVGVLLLVRGGGSIEDLWAFNDATLARRIRACAVPVVCGVGHEHDFTIADFAADLRAATPTAAAELASAGFVELGPALDRFADALRRAMRRALERAAQRVDRAQLRLVHPAERITRQRERLGHLQLRLEARIGNVRATALARIDALAWRLHGQRPQLAVATTRLAALGERLAASQRKNLRDAATRLDGLAEALDHLDPTRVLSRGYGIVRDAAGQVVSDAGQLAPGAQIAVALARGSLDARVVASHPPARPSSAGDLSGPDKPD
ncbi:MAG: exodeoxyribonuclease VII large subunit [Rhodocyclaceae bacterium]|nr:exodeoxyribonuclease VII large subunit [Rhodocyclaceae bacterium]